MCHRNRLSHGRWDGVWLWDRAVDWGRNWNLNGDIHSTWSVYGNFDWHRAVD